MPWEERSLMDVRLRFVQDVHRPGWSVAEVSRRYQVSRKTGYKWLERYGKAGPGGLVDRSHRPYSCPHATPAAVVEQILGLQRRYRWSARKVRWLLAQRVPIELVPTVATVHRILERHGRTGRRRRAHHRFHAGRPDTAFGPPDPRAPWPHRPTPASPPPLSRRAAGHGVRSAQCDLDRGLQRAIPRMPWGDSRRCRCGGCSSAFDRS